MRGEGVTGVGWRLTDRGLGREEREKRGGRLLGQSSVTATSAYLGVSDNSALELARSISV